MKKSRIKIKLPAIASRAEAESIMTDLAIAANHKRKLIADRDAEIIKLVKRIAEPVAILDAAIEDLTHNLQRWAESNTAEFPKGRKSLALANGTLGFRTGTPKLALLNRSWNWGKVLEAVQGLLPNFIRSKPEIDREALIAQANELAEFLPKVGVKVTQDESFYVEPNLTDLESRKTVEAA